MDSRLQGDERDTLCNVFENFQTILNLIDAQSETIALLEERVTALEQETPETDANS